MQITEGDLNDAPLVAQMFRRMWLDNGMKEADIVPNAEERVIQFIKEGRRSSNLRMFLISHERVNAGCAVCQVFSGLYPNILQPKVRKYGYIWGVYVIPEARRVGLGKILTERCTRALKEIGCTHAILHAAPMGEGVYERMGFVPNNEKRLALALS